MEQTELHPYAIDRTARSAHRELLVENVDQRIDVLAQDLEVTNTTIATAARISAYSVLL